MTRMRCVLCLYLTRGWMAAGSAIKTSSRSLAWCKKIPLPLATQKATAFRNVALLCWSSTRFLASIYKNKQIKPRVDHNVIMHIKNWPTRSLPLQEKTLTSLTCRDTMKGQIARAPSMRDISSIALRAIGSTNRPPSTRLRMASSKCCPHLRGGLLPSQSLAVNVANRAQLPSRLQMKCSPKHSSVSKSAGAASFSTRVSVKKNPFLTVILTELPAGPRSMSCNCACCIPWAL